MTRKHFPAFKTHKLARCFHCERLLERLTVSEHAPGSGAFRGECLRCKMTTWYDCPEALRGDA